MIRPRSMQTMDKERPMQGRKNRKILRGKLQRNLRGAPVDAEDLPWRHVRCRRVEGCKFRRSIRSRIHP